MLYMVTIHGWTEVKVFSADIEKAKKIAIREKKKFAKDDLEKWTWETVSEYYGTSIDKIADGTIIVG